MLSDELMIACACCGNIVSELETMEDTTWRGEKVRICKDCFLSNKCDNDYEYTMDDNPYLEAVEDDRRLERLENEESKDQKESE